MAHGASLKAHNNSNNSTTSSKAGVGSRRIFAPNFKLRVLDSYRNDPDCKGNQRATARKYGIHRRQIQKWLQVESALRNAVKKDGCIDATEGARERDAKESIEAALDGENRRQRGDDEDRRVPALTESIADVQQCGVRGEAGAGAGPLDLSFKRPAEMSMTMTNAPAPAPAMGPVSSWPVQDGNLDGAGRIQVSKSLLEPPAAQPSPHEDIWDLSCKTTRKRRRTPSPEPEQPSKSVKLFKPYLLDDMDISNINNNNNNKEIDDKEGRGEKVYGENDKERDGDCSSVCCSAVCSYYNGVCDIKSEYCGSYSLHELQPSYYYYYHHPSYRGEFDCYEEGIRKNGNDCNGCCYEDISYGQNGLKHRQSYSLDFKLSAIDCYYQDSVCKGNQRAVANKYNIHRRQVQKWLKQAEELRLKNESLKQIHAT